MKNILLLLSICLLASCGSEIAGFESCSEDGTTCITVDGSRFSSLDPYKAQFTVRTENSHFKEETANLELMVSELSLETVSFDWKDANNVVISIKRRDGTMRNIKVSISQDKFHLYEL